MQNQTREEEKNIRSKTREAFMFAKKADVVAAICKLCELHGVRVPIASAILAMRFPNKYAIIDRRVLLQLGEKGEKWSKDYKSNPNTYDEYLIRLIKEAKEKKMLLRDYEFSLYKEGRRKRRPA